MLKSRDLMTAVTNLVEKKYVDDTSGLVTTDAVSLLSPRFSQRVNLPTSEYLRENALHHKNPDTLQ